MSWCIVVLLKGVQVSCGDVERCCVLLLKGIHDQIKVGSLNVFGE